MPLRCISQPVSCRAAACLRPRHLPAAAAIDPFEAELEALLNGPPAPGAGAHRAAAHTAAASVLRSLPFPAPAHLRVPRLLPHSPPAGKGGKGKKGGRKSGEGADAGGGGGSAAPAAATLPPHDSALGSELAAAAARAAALLERARLAAQGALELPPTVTDTTAGKKGGKAPAGAGSRHASDDEGAGGKAAAAAAAAVPLPLPKRLILLRILWKGCDKPCEIRMRCVSSDRRRRWRCGEYEGDGGLAHSYLRTVLPSPLCRACAGPEDGQGDRRSTQ